MLILSFAKKQVNKKIIISIKKILKSLHNNFIINAIKYIYFIETRISRLNEKRIYNKLFFLLLRPESQDLMKNAYIIKLFFFLKF